MFTAISTFFKTLIKSLISPMYNRKIARNGKIKRFQCKTFNPPNMTSYVKVPHAPMSKADFFANCFLRSNELETPVATCLMHLLHDNAAGVDWKCRYENIDYRPFVEFCINNSISGSHIKGNENILHHLFRQLETVDDIIKSMCPQYETWNNFYSLVQSRPEALSFKDYFTILTEYWTYIKDHTRTYRLLGDLASICEFNESEETKNALESLLYDFSSSWTAEDKKYA